MKRALLLVGLMLAHRGIVSGQTVAQTFEQQFLDESRTSLVQSARLFGDARRGAVLFHQPMLTCSKCHQTKQPGSQLGPRLTEMNKDMKDELLVEAILEPSKTIKKGFETQTIITTSGKTLMGLLISEDRERVVLGDASRNGEQISVLKSEIEERQSSRVSLMPAGQVNALSSRQQFLDLLRYMMELRDGGAARAKELEPPAGLLALALPEYEKQIDHAGMIRSADADSFKRGEALYRRHCLSCHGTQKEPGTLPTSLRFGAGQFKNGSDPHAMYQTLTGGYGMMAAQTWMVPEQKYDVIHYIREAYVKAHNPLQYKSVDEAYLAKLPRGTTRGPKPNQFQPWTAMDYGPFLMGTFEVGQGGKNIAYKGIAVRLDPGNGGVGKGKDWVLYEHDTMRVAALWSGTGFIDWKGINFDGEHQVHPRIVGKVHLANATGPGWGSPVDQSFSDPRLRGRDNKPYGPMPREWLHYRGLHQRGQEVELEYTVGGTTVLERPGQVSVSIGDQKEQSIFTRTLKVGPRSKPLALLVSGEGAARVGGNGASYVRASNLAIGLTGTFTGITWELNKGVRLQIPEGNETLRFTIWHVHSADVKDRDRWEAMVAERMRGGNETSAKGETIRWPEVLKTEIAIGSDDGPFATDVLTHPTSNPWKAQMRFTGLDFFPDGRRMAVCSWDGDVWLVAGIDQPAGELKWRRIASGLFQPLGIKIHQNRIYVSCRDQIASLHDRNGDDEINFIESFNNDHQVTEHFHEFAMGLQTDAEGNFYYAKSARHALPAVVPHHGTLLRVSKDGSITDIVATGFRAANGVCLNPDGTFFVTDQEGHWTPKNRINHVKSGGFYGNMMGYHQVKDTANSAMEQPLCWVTNAMDRSPSELVRVTGENWKQLHGSLLNFSYGFGKIFIVPHEKVGDRYQGGMCELPLTPIPTGIMRGRFHPENGYLYACGMFAWAGNQTQPGGLYRIRCTGRPIHLPLALRAKAGGIELTFSDPLDRSSAEDAKNYSISTWSLLRSANYGSQHQNEKALKVQSASVSPDCRTVFLTIPDVKPTWCMQIACSLKSESNQPVVRIIHNTIHELNPK